MPLPTVSTSPKPIVSSWSKDDTNVSLVTVTFILPIVCVFLFAVVSCTVMSQVCVELPLLVDVILVLDVLTSPELLEVHL